MSAPAIKYTDRDVRENENLTEMAYKYLHKYEGEFPYLVDCKQRIALGMSLTSPMIRGVLNCMRVDPRVPFDMPAPLVPDAEVIEMFPKKKKGKKGKKTRPQDCPLLTAGVYHHHKQSVGFLYNYCRGLYRINRETHDQKARIHDDILYVAGKSPQSILLHKPMHAFTTWHVPTHEYGWLELYRGYVPFELNVKLGCKHPSWLRNPILLRQSDVDEYHDDIANNRIDTAIHMWKSDGKAQPTQFKICKRCFPDEE